MVESRIPQGYYSNSSLYFNYGIHLVPISFGGPTPPYSPSLAPKRSNSKSPVNTPSPRLPKQNLSMGNILANIASKKTADGQPDPLRLSRADLLKIPKTDLFIGPKLSRASTFPLEAPPEGSQPKKAQTFPLHSNQLVPKKTKRPKPSQQLSAKGDFKPNLSPIPGSFMPDAPLSSSPPKKY